MVCATTATVHQAAGPVTSGRTARSDALSASETERAKIVFREEGRYHLILRVIGARGWPLSSYRRFTISCEGETADDR